MIEKAPYGKEVLRSDSGDELLLFCYFFDSHVFLLRTHYRRDVKLQERILPEFVEATRGGQKNEYLDAEWVAWRSKLILM